MNEESKPKANRIIKAFGIYVGLNGLYIASWPFIGLYYMLFRDTAVFMGIGGMFICILIGGLMIRTPFQVYRDYSRTTLAGVILCTLISVCLNVLMILPWVAETYEL